KALLATADSAWWIKGPATFISELSARFGDLPDDQRAALVEATPETIREALTQLSLATEHAAYAAAGVDRIEDRLREMHEAIQTVLCEPRRPTPTDYAQRLQEELIDFSSERARHKSFFGRKDIMATLDGWLAAPDPPCGWLLVNGGPGMGKSALLRKFKDVASALEDLDCTVRSFVLHQGADLDTFLERLVHEVFGMRRTTDGRSWVAGPRAREQITALAGLARIDKLLETLAPKEWRCSSQILLDVFQVVSESLAPNRRLVFIIDPEKYMLPNSSQAWVPLLCNLPAKFVLVFAQRPDDVLANDPDLSSTITIPEGELAELDEQACEEFIQRGLAEIGCQLSDEEQVAATHSLRQLHGWPYAIREGLLLLAGGASPDKLQEPADTKAKRLLEQLTQIGGAVALRVVYALTVLEVPVPVPVLGEFLALPNTEVRRILQIPTVQALVKTSKEGSALFHSLFADHVRAQMKDDLEWVKQHEIAASMFEARLEADKRDELALRRLPHHTQESRGLPAYFEIVLRLSNRQLQLGLLSDATRGLESALYNEPGAKERASLANSLGSAYATYGDLEGAEEKFRVSLAINEEIGNREGIANNYGNLGQILQTRGDLDGATEMFGKSLAINEEIGHKGGIASTYGNLGQILQSRGDLDGAAEMFGRSLAICEETGDVEGKASGYGSMAIIYTIRGDLGPAENMFRKALAVSTEHGYKESMASSYGNLGIIFDIRGNLELAEENYGKALAINEEIGHKVGTASCYCNLGAIHATRGNLDLAEKMLKKALAINEEIGHKEGIANTYGNLGQILQSRGDLDGAAEVIAKSLSINEEIDHKGGIGSNIGNLGNILHAQGDLDGAERMQRKALAINEELGHKEGVATNCGNIGVIFHSRGELDCAEMMFDKSLAISRELGYRVGMASACGNLGLIYRTRGELDGAEKMFEESLAINVEIGNKADMAKSYANLGLIYTSRGDVDRAMEAHKKLHAIERELGGETDASGGSLVSDSIPWNLSLGTD
ncbi:MAG: ATP-binding protein, partial [Proteobacteria bacterium]|nr:ATP-binding protein [Pseudomonadota bacterium]